MAPLRLCDSINLVWRGRAPNIEKRGWQGIGENSTVSEDILRDLPVVDPDTLPLVDVSTRDAVWAKMSVDAQLLGVPQDDTDDDLSDDGVSDGKAKHEKVNKTQNNENSNNNRETNTTPRRRALHMQPTNEASVPLTRYALHPTVLCGI